jgi:hypothetical protein
VLGINSWNIFPVNSVYWSTLEMYVKMHAWIRSSLSVSWMSAMHWKNGNSWVGRTKRKHLSEWCCEVNHRILNSHTTPFVNRIRVYLLAAEFIGVFCPCYVLSFSCGETGCVFVFLVFLTLFTERKKRYHSENERNVTEPVVFWV